MISNDYIKCKNTDIKYNNKNVISLINYFNEYLYKLTKNKDFIIRGGDDLKKRDMTLNPKVSIIIPVYNGENYIDSAIESALRQTYDNTEIIVINDGSTDNTEKICKKYGDKIIYIHKQNGGVSSALNLGIENMTGDYFSWLSHDDLYYPEKIEVEINYLLENNLLNTKTILYSNYDTIDKEGKLLNRIRFNNFDLNQDSSFSLLKGAINGLTLLIPKNAFANVGIFDEKLRCVQDYQLWFEMYKKGYNFVHIPYTLAVTRIHDSSVTNTSPKVKSEGNKFWIDLINYFDDKNKIRIMGSEYNYYYWLSNLFVGGPYTEAQELCYQRCRELEKKYKKDINKLGVDVIIPIGNDEKLSINTLNSVLEQTYENIKIILIETSKIKLVKINDLVTKFKNKIELISFSEYSKNKEIYKDIIKKSNSEYISFVFPGNIFAKNKIKDQLLKTYLSKCNVSHTSYYLKIDSKSVFIDSGYQSGTVFPNIIEDCLINKSTLMLKRTFIIDNNIVIPHNFNSYNERIFYLQLLENSKILGIREPLLNVRYSEVIDNQKILLNIIRYILKEEKYQQYEKELKIVMKQYLNIIDDSENEHVEELLRYQYLLSKNYKLAEKIRKVKNVILFKKSNPRYLLTTNELIYGNIDKIIRKIKKGVE